MSAACHWRKKGHFARARDFTVKIADFLINRDFDPEVVRDIIRKVDLNEYKRKQAAPGLKITPLAFGVGRRIPIVQKYVS